MRQIGTLKEEALARKFAAYLLTKGIKATVEVDGSDWDVWVRDEDHLEEATAELENFEAAPDAPIYEGVELQAQQIQREEITQARKARENVVEMRSNWKGPGTARKKPLTITIIVICAVLGLMSGMSGEANNSEANIAKRALMFRDAQAAAVDPATGEASDVGTFYSIKRGEIWRLVTPIFLHGDFLHLVFNMYWLYYFGSMIEDTIGTWKYALLIVAVALLSNLMQATIVDWAFLGMSGVVYGLFGFAWMKAMFEPEKGIYISQLTVLILVIWFFVCFTGMVGPVANWAHAGGLISGLAVGFLPYWVRQQSK